MRAATRRALLCRPPTGGFTLIELLMVIALIALLTSLAGVAIGRAIGVARDKATRATLRKVDTLLREQLTEMNRLLDTPQLQKEISAKLNTKRTQLGVTSNKYDKALALMIRKDYIRNAFPQSFTELCGPDGKPGAPNTDDDGNGYTDFMPNGAVDVLELGVGNNDDAGEWATILKRRVAGFQNYAQNYGMKHRPQTESGILLALLLTEGSDAGVAPASGVDFSSSELIDTDGDEFLELVDSWGQPLRFYRWPTRLIRPGGDGAPVNRNLAGLLMDGLPAAPVTVTEIDPLTKDPSDDLGLCSAMINAGVITGAAYESLYYTRDTYYLPLIVSAGPDKELGLNEPNDATSALGRLASPVASILGNLATAGDSALNDNLTNLQRQK